jgi:hypothetical protein
MFISENTTPYLAEAFTALDKTCVKSCVVVVRATFEVDGGGDCRISERQSPFVFADTSYADPETTSVRVESDFVPVKPRAEVLLDAVAMAPGGRATDRVEVALLGPSINKRAIVTGERRWFRGALGIQATRPTPFRTIPLAWHLTFGGTDRSFGDEAQTRSDPRNPAGRGFHVNASPAAIDGRFLPCVEHPQSRIANWDDRPEPIGFGPVPRFAADRARHAGTYDQRWMDNTLPFLPADFDDRYYLAAAPDQQLAALAEGMEFACLNMNESGTYRVRLPRLSVPVWFMFDDRPRVATLAPDTVILEPDKGTVVLLGRARTVLPRKFTRLREIRVGLRRASAAASVRRARGEG